MSDIIQQVIPTRIPLQTFRDCHFQIALRNRLVSNDILSIEIANANAGRPGGRVEDDETFLYNNLRESIATLEETLGKALDLTSDVLYGLKTLEFDDAFNTQIWTELHLYSTRRYLAGVVEATKFLRVRTAVPRLYSRYTGFEILPKGHCIALKVIRGLWLAEDKLRAIDGQHPLFRNFSPDVRPAAEDIYLLGVIEHSMETCEQLLKTCELLITTFEMIWPSVGYSARFRDTFIAAT